MAQRAFVTFGDYNGYKDVKFVMLEKDIEWRRSLCKEGIELIDIVDVVQNQFTHNGILYQVYADWSVGPKNYDK